MTDVARTTVRVRGGDGRLLAFVGTALWWIANTPPTALRVAIDRLLAEIREQSATP